MAKHKYTNKKNPVSPKKVSVQAEGISVSATDTAVEEKNIIPEGKGGRLSFRQKSEIFLTANDRIAAIDNAKGILLFLLLFLGFGIINALPNTPVFFQPHGEYPSIRLADYMTPCLLFLVAISLNTSFRKRAEKYGEKAARKHIVTRGFIYMAAGALIGQVLFIVLVFLNPGRTVQAQGWDVLAAVGSGIIVAGLCAGKKTVFKIITAGVLLALHYVLPLIFNGLYSYMYMTSNQWGGLLSFFVFGALALLYGIFAELAFKNIKLYLAIYAATVLLSVVCIIRTLPYNGVTYLEGSTLLSILSNPLIINFKTVSIGYFVLGTAIGGFAILVMAVMNYINSRDYFLFGALGRNSVLVCLAYMVFDQFALYTLYRQAAKLPVGEALPFYVPLLVSLSFTAVVCVAAYVLDKKKIYLKL
ncbi:MAG: hypothetical protein LBQ27_02325 [Clostridiales bacterium]|jgi:hypothetical protein|nr:hypothetical protein [Clostridiales bacterium]